eukprot:scaffold55964_cov43-Phaeocystis_antarctica.AAC.1
MRPRADLGQLAPMGKPSSAKDSSRAWVGLELGLGLGLGLAAEKAGVPSLGATQKGSLRLNTQPSGATTTTYNYYLLPTTYYNNNYYYY